MSRVLVSVITGGRPALEDRPTRLFFPALAAAGITDVEWVIRSDHASAYERDDHPLNIYPVEWATHYAWAHWRHPTAVHESGGFFGAFPGREWAMRTAEDRGYDAVLQMDDNVKGIALINPSQPPYRDAVDAGTLLRLLVDLCLSTNAYMCGAQLSSIVPRGLVKIIRPGYPYSVFAERTGPGRMPYYGPFEDDIMHALEYALHGGPARTAAVVDLIRYEKQFGGTQGMRAHYNAARGLEIANRYPENARIALGRRSSSPRDTTRGVRHFLNTKGFTPVSITDPDLYAATETAIREAHQRGVVNKRAWDRDKIARRAQK